MTQTERRATIARFLRSVVPISADEAMGLADCVAPDVPCDCTTLRDRLAEVERERDEARRERSRADLDADARCTARISGVLEGG